MHDHPQSPEFDLSRFLPYLLNQAAEVASHSFQAHYRERYGMTRTQWRIVAHLGGIGPMTAAEICARAHEEKTKVSRAVATLQAEGYLQRDPDPRDRRSEYLSLTGRGHAVWQEIGQVAALHNKALIERLGAGQAQELTTILRQIAGMK